METIHRTVPVLLVWLFWFAGTVPIFGQNAEKPTDQQTSQGAGVEVKAKSLDFSNGEAVIQRFEMDFTTHSANLDFDLAAVAFLGDEKGELVPADSWTGGRGGHHLSGILTFSGKRLAGLRSFQLVLDLPGLGKRVFSWSPGTEGSK